MNGFSLIIILVCIFVIVLNENYILIWILQCHHMWSLKNCAPVLWCNANTNLKHSQLLSPTVGGGDDHGNVDIAARFWTLQSVAMQGTAFLLRLTLMSACASLVTVRPQERHRRFKSQRRRNETCSATTSRCLDRPHHPAFTLIT